MKTPKKNTVITLPTTPTKYLHGYNGGDLWEWTEDRKAAWRMYPIEALSRAARVVATHPGATVKEI